MILSQEIFGKWSADGRALLIDLRPWLRLESVPTFLPLPNKQGRR